MVAFLKNNCADICHNYYLQFNCFYILELLSGPFDIVNIWAYTDKYFELIFTYY